MLTGWHQLPLFWWRLARMWPFDIPAKLSINMYIDGIISHIKALHTSVQPSVNCTMPAPSVGHTVREDSVSMVHTCLLIRGEDSQHDKNGQFTSYNCAVYWEYGQIYYGLRRECCQWWNIIFRLYSTRLYSGRGFNVNKLIIKLHYSLFLIEISKNGN